MCAGWWDAIRPPQHRRCVAISPQSPPPPIPGIHQTRTLDTPVNVFIVNTIALSPLCPPPFTGQVWHVLLLPLRVVIVVVVSTSSQGCRRHSAWRQTTMQCRGPRRSLPSHALGRLLFPSSPPLQGCSLSSLTASTTLRAYILETLSSTNHSHWLLRAQCRSRAYTLLTLMVSDPSSSLSSLSFFLSSSLSSSSRLAGGAPSSPLPPLPPGQAPRQ